MVTSCGPAPTPTTLRRQAAALARPGLRSVDAHGLESRGRGEGTPCRWHQLTASMRSRIRATHGVAHHVGRGCPIRRPSKFSTGYLPWAIPGSRRRGSASLSSKLDRSARRTRASPSGLSRSSDTPRSRSQVWTCSTLGSVRPAAAPARPFGPASVAASTVADSRAVVVVVVVVVVVEKSWPVWPSSHEGIGRAAEGGVPRRTKPPPPHPSTPRRNELGHRKSKDRVATMCGLMKIVNQEGLTRRILISTMTLKNNWLQSERALINRISLFCAYN